MKIIYALLLTCVAGSAAQAQKGRFQAGINLANVSISDNGKVDDAKMLTSFQLGVIGDFPLGDIFAIQPGLLFTGKGSKTESGDPSSATYYKATTNPFYVELPVNFVFKTPSIAKGPRFFAGAGPYVAAGVSGKNKAEGKALGVAFNSEKNIEFSNDDPTTLNYEEGAGFGILRRFDFGVNGTAGIEGKSMTLAVNYGLGLTKLQSGSDSGADNNNKDRVLSFAIGFKF